MSHRCDNEHEDTGARCYLLDDTPHTNHQGFTHWPGQLVVWPAQQLAETEQKSGEREATQTFTTEQERAVNRALIYSWLAGAVGGTVGGAGMTYLLMR